MPCMKTRFHILALLAIFRLGAQADVPFALGFSGTNDFVAVPHNFFLNPYAFTATAWIKTTQATGEMGIINKYVVGSLNGWQVFLYNGEVRAWYFGDNTH